MHLVDRVGPFMDHQQGVTQTPLKGELARATVVLLWYDFLADSSLCRKVHLQL